MSGAGVSPLALFDPSTYAKLQSIQRRQALGQSLLQQGSEESNRPYAGLVNAGRSLLGAYLLKRGDEAQANLFGGDQGAAPVGIGGAASTQPGPVGNPPAGASIQPPSVTPPGGVPSPSPQASAPSQTGGMPSHIAQIYNAPGFPRIPGVDPQIALTAMMQGGPAWQAYMTAYYQSVGPTPEQKNAIAATGGDTAAANELLRGKLAKDATVIVRPQGVAMNAATGHGVGIPGATGMTPVQQPDGTWVLTMDPRSQGAVTAAAAAQGLGRAQTTPDIAYDASGRGYPTSQAQMLGRQPAPAGPVPTPQPGAMPAAGPAIGAGNMAPQMGAPPGQTPPAGPVLAAPPPGAGEFGGGIGKSAAEQNQNLRVMASDVNTRLNVLGNILNLSRITQTNSPEWITESRNLAAGLGQVLGHPVDATNQAALNTEIQKYMEQYATRMHQASGGTGTDAQLEAIQHANPNDKMFPATLQRVVPWIMANEAGLRAKANAQDAFNPQNPQAQSSFEAFWRNNYSPRIAQFEMMTPVQKAGYLHDPNAFPSKQALLDFQKQYQALHRYFTGAQ